MAFARAFHASVSYNLAFLCSETHKRGMAKRVMDTDRNKSHTHTTHTVIVGASAAGLAMAACLKREGIPFILLEQSQQVASNWRKHYDRLHLHTSKSLSTLPYFPLPKSYPRYPSRDQVVEYLELYAQHHGLEPRFGQGVSSVSKHDGEWVTETQDARYVSKNVVIATGYARVPNLPTLPGQTNYQGEILHSAAYKNGAAFAGKSVLVVGFGNSGGEIAIDLVEHGARTALSVRSPVNVVPRDLLGIPILGIGIVMNLIPPKLADLLAAPMLRLSIGDVGKLGLQKRPYGPNQQMKQDGRIPLLDIGTISHIRAGHIRVHPGIESLTERGVKFTDGGVADFDAIVLATGYRPGLADFMRGVEAVMGEDGAEMGAMSGKPTDLPGLYFCGFYVSPTGMLREISIEAKRIAASISAGQVK